MKQNPIVEQNFLFQERACLINISANHHIKNRQIWKHYNSFLFIVLFSCPEQLNRWPCHSLTHWVTHWLLLLTLQSDPRDLRPLRHLIRVMKRHDMTKKKWTKTNTKTKTFWEHLLRAILETCDLWDICSEWWEDMTWPKNWQRQIQRQWQWQRQGA